MLARATLLLAMQMLAHGRTDISQRHASSLSARQNAGLTSLRLRGGERTFAMLKPDVASDERIVGEIKARIADAGLTIERERRCSLSRRQCKRFYAEHKLRPFFGALVDFMSSGEVVMFELSGDGAILAWRGLLGPTNTGVARKEAPRSLRALYGTDATRNAAHGSDSTSSASRELRLMFGRFPSIVPGAALMIAAVSVLATLKATGRLTGWPGCHRESE